MSAQFFINKRIADYLNFESLRNFLRPLPIHSSGIKVELIRRIEDAINSGQLSYDCFEEFLFNELRYGHNRTLFITRLNPASLHKVKNLQRLKQSLDTADLPSTNFSNYTSSFPISEDPELVHLNIVSESNTVEKIEMCYAYMIMVSRVNFEGESVQEEDTDYVWITIDIVNEQLIISVRPRANVFDSASKASVAFFNTYTTHLTSLFSIRYLSNDDMKFTLYNIFKELTSKAEKPYVEKVAPLIPLIKQFCDNITTQVELPSSEQPVNLPFRVRRLVERALIQDDFFNFSSYAIEKVGRIDKFFYADETGARVNASSSEGEGIELNDIYFDTRDTIDDQRTFNKLWVTWFMPERSPKKEVETRLEVTTNYFLVHFYKYHYGVEQEHVLSSIEKFKQLQS